MMHATMINVGPNTRGWAAAVNPRIQLAACGQHKFTLCAFLHCNDLYREYLMIAIKLHNYCKEKIAIHVAYQCDQIKFHSLVCAYQIF